MKGGGEGGIKQIWSFNFLQLIKILDFFLKKIQIEKDKELLRLEQVIFVHPKKKEKKGEKSGEMYVGFSCVNATEFC